MSSERYTRLRQLGWDLDLLRSSQVMVVGAGALGNEIIKNLALAGVGNLIIIDSDIIENHNLTRSVLFRPSDVGRRKAEVAASAAQDLDPSISARWFDTAVQDTLGLGVFREVDVVLGGVDNIQTRRDLNRACLLTDTPFIDGGLFYLDGDVRTFLPPFPVCFDCTLTQEERDEGWRRWSCLDLSGDRDSAGGPTAPTVASMIGELQAQLALKYLHRASDSPYRMEAPNGVRIRLNGFADEYERWDLGRDMDCPTHLTATRIPESSLVPIAHGRDMSALLLLTIAQEELGPDAYVELGFDVIHTLSCPECGRSEPSLRRQGTLRVKDSLCWDCTPANCQACGNSISQAIDARPELVFPDRADCAECFESNPIVMRDAQTLNRIEPGSPALDYSVAELGVPMLDILEAKAFDPQSSVFLQLEGDRDRVFGVDQSDHGVVPQ